MEKNELQEGYHKAYYTGYYEVYFKTGHNDCQNVGNEDLCAGCLFDTKLGRDPWNTAWCPTVSHASALPSVFASWCRVLQGSADIELLLNTLCFSAPPGQVPETRKKTWSPNLSPQSPKPQSNHCKPQTAKAFHRKRPSKAERQLHVL